MTTKWDSANVTEYFNQVFQGIKEKAEQEIVELLGEKMGFDLIATCHNLEINNNRNKFFQHFVNSGAVACIYTDSYDTYYLMEKLADQTPDGLYLEPMSYACIGVYIDA